MAADSPSGFTVKLSDYARDLLAKRKNGMLNSKQFQAAIANLTLDELGYLSAVLSREINTLTRKRNAKEIRLHGSDLAM